MRSSAAAAVAIEGWFWREEGLWYAERAAAIRGGTVVEVGCWKGLSTSFIGPACRDNRTVLWCVDSWKGSRDAYAEAYAAVLAAEDVKAAFARNMAALGVPVSVLAMPSVEAAARFAEGSCDLVFIDGSHDEESVAQDLRAWFPKVRPGGLLAGHDLHPRTPGVEAALSRFARALRLEVGLGSGRIWLLRPPG